MNITLYLSNKGIHKLEKSLINLLLKKQINCNISNYKSIVHYKNINKSICEQGFKVDLFDVNKKDLLILWHELRKLLNIQCIYVESKSFKGCLAKIFKNEKIKCSQSIDS